MATLMQPLTAPETTWQRIEQDQKSFGYTGAWTKNSILAGTSGGTYNYTATLNDTILFKFSGTKIRIISRTANTNATQVQITIDGIVETFSENTATTQLQILVYEKTGLANQIHTVEIKAIQSGATAYTAIDAIDIDDTGYTLTAVGNPILTADNGFQRIDDLNPFFNYVGTWTALSTTSAYYGGYKQTTVVGDYVEFQFKSTNFRIIGLRYSNNSTSITVTIDGVSETYNPYTASSEYIVLLYEKTGLSDGVHTVRIEHTGATTKILNVDAFDIDDTGYIVTPISSQKKNNVLDISNLGDYMRCEYTVLSNGSMGYFSNLGSTTKAHLPYNVTNLPNGSFDLVYIGNDHLGRMMLLADRPLQHTIHARYLTQDGIASPSGVRAEKWFKYKPTVPTMTSNTNGTITLTASYEVVATSGNIYNAFDNNINTKFGVTTAITPPADIGRHWIKVDYGLGNEKIIKCISHVSTSTVTTSNYGIKYWKLMGSNDDITYDFIADGNHVNNTSYEFDDFVNENSYRYYRYEFESWQSTSYFAVNELQFYEDKPINPFDGYNVYMRLPKKGEFESLMKNTLGGLITAGDSRMWNNTTVGSWCYDGSSSSRYSFTTSATLTNATTQSVTVAFRPMLIIESTTNVVPSYLLKDSSNVYTVDGANGTLQNLGTLPVTFDMFLNNGFTNLGALTDSMIKSITNPVLMYSTRSLLPKKLRMTYVPNDKLVFANGDIDLVNIANIDYFNVNANLSGNGEVKLIASNNGGVTWYTWDGASFVIINPTASDVKLNGMSISTFNSLDWNAFGKINNKLRFGYLLSLDSTTDVAETTSLTSQLDFKGKLRECVQSVQYDVDYIDNIIELSIYDSGDFKISYADGLGSGGSGGTVLTWGTF